MKTILRKALVLITVTFFTFSSSNPVLLYAWPWSRATNNNEQGSDFSTTANIDGSVSGGMASGRASAQATGPNFNASGEAVTGANIRQGVAGGEVRGQVASDIAGIPVNAIGNASATGRGTVNSSGRPSVDFQTQTNLTGSIGRSYHAEDGGSIASGPYTQGSTSHASQNGNASFNASGNVGSFTAQGSYSGTAGSSGIQLDAYGNVKATLAEGEVRTHYQTGMGSSTVDVTAGGRSTVGVEATGAGHASVDRSGVSAGANLDAMAGARQRADVGGTLNLLGLVKITARVEGEAIEGTGLKTHAQLQASGRGLTVSTGLAAAAGLGGGITTEFDIDVSGITKPIGEAIDKVVKEISKGVKGLFDKIFGKKEEDKKAQEEAGCAAEGDSVFCGGGAMGGAGPRPRPDPEAERRHREEEQRREREERRREEEERKRREKEEKEERKRREKEERKKEAEETWRKLPPLPKPKTGGATGRVFDPETGEITEGVMEPDGSTVITKRGSDGSVIGKEEHPGRYQVSSSTGSDSASKTDSNSSLPLDSPQPLQGGPQDGFDQVPNVRELAARNYARVDHNLNTGDLIMRDLHGNILGVVQKGNVDLKAFDMEDRAEKFSQMNTDELKQAMRNSQEQIDRAESDMIGASSEIHLAEQKLDKLEERKQNATRLGFDTSDIDRDIQQVKSEIKSAEHNIQDAADRAENARRNMEAANQRLSDLKRSKGGQLESKTQRSTSISNQNVSSNFAALDALKGGGLQMLNSTPTAALDASPQSRDMNNAFVAQSNSKADSYKAECDH